MQLSAVAVMVPRAQVSAVRVREILERQDKITDEQVNKELNRSVSNSLALHQVSFKFDEAKRQALSDLSVNVKAGQTLAIIGGTGSGKSTILNLIARLIDPTSGSVNINGIDIRQMSQHDLHEKVALTQQKAVLFLEACVLIYNLGKVMPLMKKCGKL